MPSISMIICWSALALEEINKAIRKIINITIICFMFTLLFIDKGESACFEMIRKI